MYQNILVAVETSENSYRAVLEASKIAKEGAFITLINVKDGSEAQTEVLHGNAASDDTLESFKKQTDLLESKNINYKLLKKSGTISKTIVKEANSGAYDVIIVGKKGKKLKDIIIGSVSKYVLKEANIPVLLVK